MDDLHTKLETWRTGIQTELREILDELGSQSYVAFTGDEYIFKELKVANQIGKAWRGILCRLTAESFGETENEIAKKIGALIELLHYGLLIHDDIIDQSPIRRNCLSFPARLKALYEAHGVLGHEKHGVGVAIATGDYVIQWVLNQVIHIRIDKDTRMNLISLFLDTITETTRAQVFDAAAFTPVTDTDEIIGLYQGKTGSYSFVLPLISGFIVSGRDDETAVLFLKTIGESLGVIMQSLDDLAWFNDTGEYRNLREDMSNKQPTLWSATLLPRLNAKEKEQFIRLFWLDSISAADAKYVRDLCVKYKIKETISDITKNYAMNCHDLIHDLPLSKQNRKLFHQFVELIMEYGGV